VGKKKNNGWLIYHRENGEIVAFVRGKRDIKTTQKVKKRIKRLGISYDRVATDWWDSFLATLWGGEDLVGKAHRREQVPNEASDKESISEDLLFFKKLLNHLKAFAMSFFYITYGFV
jgi:IS1 family transposase